MPMLDLLLDVSLELLVFGRFRVRRFAVGLFGVILLVGVLLELV